MTQAPLTAGTVAWQINPPDDSRTVIAKATCDLVQGARATFRDPPASLSGDVHEGEGASSELVYPSDFAIFKPGADVTVRASAVPAGGPSTTATVQLLLGRGSKKLHRVAAVFGDRTWSGAKVEPSAPARFRRIPLTAGRAFGGAGFDANPLGRGFGTPPPGTPHFLPNIEDPKALIQSPRDTPSPVLFGPVPPGFRSRWSKLGTYDDRWLRSRWPYFPADFDWGYFRAAPAEQQVDYLEGDEPFELLGMSAERPAIHGSLPGVRVRCFAQQAASAAGFVEVTMRLDTVHFDVDAAVVHLVWRGVLGVRDDQASDVRELFLLAEPLARSPASIEAARAAYEAEKASIAKARQADGFEEPEPAEEPPPPAPEAAPAPPPAQPIDFTMLPPDIIAKLAAIGVDPSAIANQWPPPEPAPVEPPGIDVFVDNARKGGASEEDIAAMRASRERAAAAQAPAAPDIEAPAAKDEGAKDEGGLPEIGSSLDGAELDERDLSGMDLSNRSFRGATLRRAKLTGCKLTGACFDDAQLGDADLTGADLSLASLVRADLTGAALAGCTLAGADLGYADLSRVRAPKAIFDRAKGDQVFFCDADLAGASFAEARLPGADFTAATIDGAVFERAEIADVRLFDATGKNARFAEAKMPGARADGVRLPGAALGSVVAPRSIWEGAVLDDATFYGADLRASGFASASCVRTTFSGADLAEARFTRASLVEAQMLKTNLMKSTLEGANLTRADARGANLHGAETWKAVLDGARLDGAILTGTKLEGTK